MVAIVAIYLIMGGYFAMTLTDFIQGLIMIVGSVVMVVILTGKAGGLSASIQQISLNFYRDVYAKSAPDYFLLAAIVFMTSFGAWGMPQMIQKFYSIKMKKL